MCFRTYSSSIVLIWCLPIGYLEEDLCCKVCNYHYFVILLWFLRLFCNDTVWILLNRWIFERFEIGFVDERIAIDRRNLRILPVSLLKALFSALQLLWILLVFWGVCDINSFLLKFFREVQLVNIQVGDQGNLFGIILENWRMIYIFCAWRNFFGCLLLQIWRIPALLIFIRFYRQSL